MAAPETLEEPTGGNFLQCSFDSVPYDIVYSETLGRYMVAAKDLDAGEIIFKEAPLASGPQMCSLPICPGCYGLVNSKCDNCGWPICSQNCPRKTLHEFKECELLRQSGTIDRKIVDWASISDCLMLYRCLSTDEESVSGKALQEMESHWEKWDGSSLTEKVDPLVPTLRDHFGITPEAFTLREIYKMQAVLFVNAFEVRMPEVNVQAIYRLCCLLEHNCTPNTHRTIDSKTLTLTVRADTAIPKGTHISTSYCDVLWPTRQRQEFLKSSKFFKCSCERCLDPTECGAYLSGFICPLCPMLTPIIPNLSIDDSATIFSCVSCETDFDYIKSGLRCSLTKAQNELEQLDESQTPENADEYMAWIQRWTILPTTPTEQNLERTVQMEDKSKWKLYPTNSTVLDASHTLFLLYSYGEDIPLQEMTNKIKLGEHLLQAVSSITKGISRFCGTVMHELAMTRFAVLLHRIELNGIDPELKRYGQESLALMKDSLDHLKFEPPDQPEGIFYETGLSQFSRFEDLLSSLISES